MKQAKYRLPPFFRHLRNPEICDQHTRGILLSQYSTKVVEFPAWNTVSSHYYVSDDIESYPAPFVTRDDDVYHTIWPLSDDLTSGPFASETVIMKLHPLKLRKPLPPRFDRSGGGITALQDDLLLALRRLNIKDTQRLYEPGTEGTWEGLCRGLEKHVAAAFIFDTIKKIFPTTESLRHAIWRPHGMMSRRLFHRSEGLFQN
jgi:hypothetical protein